MSVPTALGPGRAQPGLTGDTPSEPLPILLPYNGGARADRALGATMELARRRPLLVWVLYVRPWDPSRGGVLVSLETREEAAHCARSAAAELRRHAIPASSMTREAARRQIAQVIVTAAERLAVGYVVLGTDGHGPVLSALLGSITRRVCRLSSVPVLLTPEAGARWTGAAAGRPRRQRPS